MRALSRTDHALLSTLLTPTADLTADLIRIGRIPNIPRNIMVAACLSAESLQTKRFLASVAETRVETAVISVLSMPASVLGSGILHQRSDVGVRT